MSNCGFAVRFVPKSLVFERLEGSIFHRVLPPALLTLVHLTRRSGIRRAFLLVWTWILDFSKLNGLVPAVVQDHSTGRVLMVGFMNEEAFRRDGGNGLRHVLQPLQKQAVAEGRDLRAPPGGQGDLDRLRSGHPARARGGAGTGGVPRGLSELLFPHAQRRRVGGLREPGLRSGTSVREHKMKLKLGIPKGQPGERDHRSVPPRRLHTSPPAAAPIFRPSTIRRSSAC